MGYLELIETRSVKLKRRFYQYIYLCEVIILEPFRYYGTGRLLGVGFGGTTWHQYTYSAEEMR
jgi:hypothetical protein